jgi:hypothetical protein
MEMGIKMKMKYLPRTTEFSYLEEELQYVRSETGHCSAGLPILQLWCFRSVFLAVLSVLSFTCSCSCSLSLRSSVSVSSVLSENMDACQW